MSERKEYYMRLVEGRSKRLSELLMISAPIDLICKEVRMLAEIAVVLDPTVFKSWSGPKIWPEEINNEQYQYATG